MESAPIQALYESPLAAKPQLREKPHQGGPSKNPAWHQGPSVCKFTVTLGLRATVVENGVGQTYSARYYNPATGRFLSRDPLDGQAKDPASLHKYLYADGDPVNGLDRTGKADLYEWAVVAAITYVVFQPIHMFVHCTGLGRAGTVIGLFGPLLGDGIGAAFAYAYGALSGLSCWTS